MSLKLTCPEPGFDAVILNVAANPKTQVDLPAGATAMTSYRQSGLQALCIHRV
jgi:hypothetical protein